MDMFDHILSSRLNMNLINLRDTLIEELKPFIENISEIKENISLLYQESERDKLIIVLEGTIKVSNMLPNSKELLLGIYKSEMILFPVIFETETTFSYLFKVNTLTKCVIGTISTANLKSIITKSDTLLRNLYLYHDYLCQKIFLQMRDIIIHDKKHALFSIFIRLYNTYGIKSNAGFKINTKVSNLMLSEYIGSTPETVSRLLSNLKSNNIIEINKGFLTIKDLNYIKEYLAYSNYDERLCLF